ncbi:MAG: 3'(2'),5'-bisphosphate nucleotidase CysQ [Oscillospiraceae bacterium]|nr:3'(2'),5'-bisphosphate nucleotidase CysQ [Oscillospiraceae bacterium]
MGEVFWQDGMVKGDDRKKTMGQRGLVVWLTGPSGAGKSTIAYRAEAELSRLGFSSYVLDGDNLRFGINSDLGFEKSDRDENIRRIGEIANLFCEAGTIAFVSAISPYQEARKRARQKIGEDNFCEVYVKASAEARKTRDPKGLYKGGMKDSPYEEPQEPDITIDTETNSIEDSVKMLVGHILERQLAHLLPKVLETALYAAYDAGKLILEVYSRDFAVEYKDDCSPLTEADKKSNELICKRLNKYAPHIDILAEESADDKKRLKNKFCFIVDPLDGTKEFVKKNGEFTVNIALAYQNETVMGVVYAPCQKKFWYAAKGHGAYALNLNLDIPRLFDETTKIKASDKTSALTVVKSRSHSDERTEALLEKNKDKIASLADVGSALKGCLIAEGSADVYYRFGPTMEWDTCAVQCVVEESGGVFMQADHSEMRYNRENSVNDKGFIILNKMENRLD